MPRRTKEYNAGWPQYVKDPIERERKIAQKMAGKQFHDVILKTNQNTINWNLIKKIKKPINNK